MPLPQDPGPIPAVPGTVVNPPSAPVSVNATADEGSTTSITITWEPPSGTVTGYRIYRVDPSGDNPDIQIGGDRSIVAIGIRVPYGILPHGILPQQTPSYSYQHTGLASGQEYNYQVAAFNGDGEGQRSLTATETTNSTAPTTPTINSAVLSDNDVDFDIIESTSSAGITEYVIYRDDALFDTKPMTPLSVTLPKKYGGKVESWKILAKDESGQISNFSNIVQITIPKTAQQLKAEKLTTI